MRSAAGGGPSWRGRVRQQRASLPQLRAWPQASWPSWVLVQLQDHSSASASYAKGLDKSIRRQSCISRNLQRVGLNICAFRFVSPPCLTSTTCWMNTTGDLVLRSPSGEVCSGTTHVQQWRAGGGPSWRGRGLQQASWPLLQAWQRASWPSWVLVRLQIRRHPHQSLNGGFLR